MPDFITLTCPSCGGKLEVTPDLEQFACGYCGKEHMVKRGGGIVSIAPLVENIKKVQQGVDRTASELAIKRLEKEILTLQEQQNKKPERPILKDLTDKEKFYLSNKFVVFTGGLSIVILLMRIIFLNSNTEFDSSFFFVFFIVFFSISILTVLKRGRYRLRQLELYHWKRTYTNLIVQLRQQIKEKQTELKHHQDLVSNYK